MGLYKTKLIGVNGNSPSITDLHLTLFLRNDTRSQEKITSRTDIEIPVKLGGGWKK